jgi:hypothetical protein
MISPFQISEIFLGYFSQMFLQNGSYNIIDYLIIFIGPGTVLFFTFYLLWAGRRKNRKIVNLTRKVLLEVFIDEFDDLEVDQLTSNGALLYPKYKKSRQLSFKDFRVVFALEERHLMLSVIISWFAGVNDYLALEANPRKGKFGTKIQLIPRKEDGQIKKHQDLLFSLDDVTLNVGKIDEFFVLKASSQRSGLYFLGDKDLLKLLYSVRDLIVRISINSAEDPSIRLYTRIDEKLDLEKLRALFIKLCDRIDSVSEKVVMKKGR